MLSADDVLNARFTTTKFRDGYDQSQVDNLLDRVVETLRQLEAGSTVGIGGRALITPKDLLSARILRTKFRDGYEPEEVDRLVTQVVGTLEEYISRARRGALSDAHPVEQRAGDVEQPADVEAAERALQEQEREFAVHGRDDAVNVASDPSSGAGPVAAAEATTDVPSEGAFTLPPGAMRTGDVLREVQYSRATLFGDAREAVVVRGPDGRTYGIARVEKTADGIVVHLAE